MTDWRKLGVRVKSALRTLGSRWRASRRIAVGMLRELSDEAAYERHLARSGRLASPAEWRRFADERLRGKYGRPKCC